MTQPQHCWCLLFFFCVFSLTGRAQQPRTVFSTEQVTSDFAYLYRTLEQTHYNLFAHVRKRRFDQRYTALRDAIPPDSLTLLQATKLFQQAAALSNTGHCEVDFPAAAYIAYARAGGTVFPLELTFEQEKAYIRNSFADTPGLAAGSQLVSINHRPIRHWLAALHPYLSAERPYLKNAKVELYSFPRLYWLAFGEQPAFTVQVKQASGVVVTLCLAAQPALAYESRRAGEIIGAARSFRYRQGVAYLQPGPFASAEPDGEARFRQFVDSVFADLRTRQVDQLVIDLRNHAGGHNAYSDYLITYFATRPFRWYSSFRLKTSTVLKAQTRPAPGAAAPSAYARAILEHADGETFRYDFPWQQPVPAAQRYRGRVLVLINRHSYSMAAVSAALVQDYGFAQLVGEETADMPTLYASQFAFSLPETGIVVKVPKGYIVRPNGSEKRCGVVPDYPCRDHLLDSADEVLNTAVDVLRAGKAVPR